MRIALEKRGPRWRFCSSSSITSSPACSPTASFTIDPLPRHAPTANLKRPSTKPPTPSRMSSTCSKLPEFVEVFLFANETVRICHGSQAGRSQRRCRLLARCQANVRAEWKLVCATRQTPSAKRLPLPLGDREPPAPSNPPPSPAAAP